MYSSAGGSSSLGEIIPEEAVADGSDGGAGSEGERSTAAEVKTDGRGDAKARMPPPLSPPREGGREEEAGAEGVKEETSPSRESEGIAGPSDVKADGCVCEGGEEGAEKDDEDAARSPDAPHPGREASYGTVSSAMFVSGTEDTRWEFGGGRRALAWPTFTIYFRF